MTLGNEAIDVKAYLERIDFAGSPLPNNESLSLLHEHHVYHVPFENLDIHYKRPFDLAQENVFRKIVTHRRGGFCYELNGLFHSLLLQLGFDSRMISARIITEKGEPGPEFDHMSVVVSFSHSLYLCDVGFGDLFIRPLQINEGIQFDGRNYFRIDRHYVDDFVLSMSADGITFNEKYLFNTTEVAIQDFVDSCIDKQNNPDSYFVKNTVCTKLTKDGRVTIFNNKFIERIKGEKMELEINGDEQLRDILLTRFGIR